MARRKFTKKDDIGYLRIAIDIAQSSRLHGNTPFGAILVSPEGKILLKKENSEITTRSCTGHAETQLADLASQVYTKEYLADCSLYSASEPCAMCSGAIYWSGIGRVVYALSEADLLKLTGNDRQNPTMHLPCRKVLNEGQRYIQVEGPFAELTEEALTAHKGYWHGTGTAARR